MRYSVSDTAEHGDYTGGARIVTDDTRRAMARILEDVRNGTYAKAWIAENEAGRPWFNKRREAEQSHSIEQVGTRLRAMMPFLKPVSATSEVAPTPERVAPVPVPLASPAR
jgi:ketol-acid reductoisomerase